jgi:hypothetical protein
MSSLKRISWELGGGVNWGSAIILYFDKMKWAHMNIGVKTNLSHLKKSFSNF